MEKDAVNQVAREMLAQARLPEHELAARLENAQTAVYWRKLNSQLSVEASGSGVIETRDLPADEDRKSTRLNSSHIQKSRMPSSA